MAIRLLRTTASPALFVVCFKSSTAMQGTASSLWTGHGHGTGIRQSRSVRAAAGTITQWGLGATRVSSVWAASLSPRVDRASTRALLLQALATQARTFRAWKFIFCDSPAADSSLSASTVKTRRRFRPPEILHQASLKSKHDNRARTLLKFAPQAAAFVSSAR